MILPPDLLNAAKKATGAKTMTEAVIKSMELAIHRKKAKELVALFGKVSLKTNLQKSRERPA
jgi:hypothetical protein